MKQQQPAEATIARRIISCRTIWCWAIEKGFASHNPFSKVEAGQQANASRKAYVDVSTIVQLVRNTTGEMALALALSRFGGLRVPPELLTLRWQDINLAQGMMTVRSPKTEHHAGGDSRVVPLFPEIRQRLEPLRKKTGNVFVGDRREEGWWKSLKDLCRRCKVDIWEKLWHNLRASCETDLCKRFPPHVVCTWLGNSLRVAEKHYLQVTPEALERAYSSCAHFCAHFCAQLTPDSRRLEETRKKVNLQKRPEKRQIGMRWKLLNGRYRTRTCDLWCVIPAF